MSHDERVKKIIDHVGGYIQPVPKVVMSAFNPFGPNDPQPQPMRPRLSTNGIGLIDYRLYTHKQEAKLTFFWIYGTPEFANFVDALRTRHIITYQGIQLRVVASNSGYGPGPGDEFDCEEVLASVPPNVYDHLASQIGYSDPRCFIRAKGWTTQQIKQARTAAVYISGCRNGKDHSLQIAQKVGRSDLLHVTKQALTDHGSSYFHGRSNAVALDHSVRLDMPELEALVRLSMRVLVSCASPFQFPP